MGQLCCNKYRNLRTSFRCLLCLITQLPGHNDLTNRHTCHFYSVCDDMTERHPDANSAFPHEVPSFTRNAESKITVIYFNNYTKRTDTLCGSVAYSGILFGVGGCSTNSVEDRGQRERGSGGGIPLVRGSGGSCNLTQKISFHIVNFS
jgi:hypothetical protein